MKRLAPWLVGLAACAVLTAGEGGGFWSDPAFQWGPRSFSRDEAERIAALAPAPPRSQQEARDFIRSQQPLLTGIVLCEARGVPLSEEKTLEALQMGLLTMPTEARREFLRLCVERKLAPGEYLRSEARRIDRQFQCAIREWYRRSCPDVRISDAQVRDWYFRHQERFLTREINHEALWILSPGEENVRQAVALLKQGVPAASVRKKFPGNADAGAVARVLELPGKQDFPEKGFTLYAGTDFQVLARADAVRLAYRPLTPELAEAIRSALYDALAKARLAEELKRMESRMELRFF